MMKYMMKIVLVAFLALSLIPMVAQAVLITGTGGIDGKGVSASADFDVASGSAMEIILTNTGILGNYTVAQVLTDVSFNMSGASITGGEVKVNVGSIWYGPGSIPDGLSNPLGGGGTDVSPEWIWATGAILHGVTFEFTISASSIAGVADNVVTNNPFSSDADLGGAPGGVNGSDFGLINSLSRFNNSDGLQNEDLIVNAVKIELIGTGFDIDNLGNVHFSYGSAHELVPGDVIPEPGTLILLGSGLVGLAGYGKLRLRRKKK